MHRLDPLLLNVYLRQNDVSVDASAQEEDGEEEEDEEKKEEEEKEKNDRGASSDTDSCDTELPFAVVRLAKETARNLKEQGPNGTNGCAPIKV